MILKDENGKAVEVTSVDGDVGEGAWIAEANYIDDANEIPDHVIDWLNEAYASQIYDEFFQSMVSRAEARADAMEDR